ncbi:hypothetical protein GE09DRAFT_1054386 [Coniochaeta sp. 2T2.1]|nr:hypothetical protein GE09DRAFT_1054386 [Coniochaeta sp. 2T2.1]
MTGSSHGRGSPLDIGFTSPRQSIDLAQVQQRSAGHQRLQSATLPQRQTPIRAKAAREEQPVEALRKTRQRVIHKYWCTKGCPERSFTTKRNLTRHIDICHLKQGSICPCCPERMRRVLRHDYFLTHLARHITGERKTPYHPNAAEILEEEKQKSRPRAPSNRPRSRNELASFSEGNDMDEEHLSPIQRAQDGEELSMDMS